ncbi:MAG: RNA polymerase sigma-70 factor [Rikenellaceae bacterium]|nr:RNA polymerase sigma-70 factor [Rikenellaceae bacterium]
MKESAHTVEKIKQGDHGSFETLFLFYFVKVRSFIDSIIRCSEDAEELAQDIFVKLWENRSSLDPGRQIGSYLYTSARNSALNYLKHKYVHDEYARSAILHTEQSTHGEEVIEAKETQLLIDMTVAGMPEQRRKIYRLSRVSGKSNEEISREMNVSKKTVENQISLALKDIKRVLSLFAFFFS